MKPCTTTPGQNGPERNGNKGVLHILQSLRTGVSPSDGGGVLQRQRRVLCKDVVSVFYSPSQQGYLQ